MEAKPLALTPIGTLAEERALPMERRQISGWFEFSTIDMG